jgi:sulfoxide reductase heme-binding subunit YedZ
MTPERPRLGARRVVRNLAIGAGVVAMALALNVVIPPAFTARRLTLITAYVGLALMSGTLLIGPWYGLRGRRPPVSIQWRRDVGIWAAVVGVLHVIVGLRVHFRGEALRYFLYAPGEGPGIPVRVDPIGWANHVGLAATVLLALLLSISNDVALRLLGTGKWKAIQRWNYAVFALVGLHGAIYQVLVKRALPAVVLFAGMLSVATVVQVAGFRQRRRSLRVVSAPQEPVAG